MPSSRGTRSMATATAACMAVACAVALACCSQGVVAGRQRLPDPVVTVALEGQSTGSQSQQLGSLGGGPSGGGGGGGDGDSSGPGGVLTRLAGDSSLSAAESTTTAAAAATAASSDQGSASGDEPSTGGRNLLQWAQRLAERLRQRQDDDSGSGPQVTVVQPQQVAAAAAPAPIPVAAPAPPTQGVPVAYPQQPGSLAQQAVPLSATALPGIIGSAFGYPGLGQQQLPASYQNQVPVDQVGLAAAGGGQGAYPAAPTTLGDGGINIVTSTPVSLSNPIELYGGTHQGGIAFGFGRRRTAV